MWITMELVSTENSWAFEWADILISISRNRGEERAEWIAGNHIILTSVQIDNEATKGATLTREEQVDCGQSI